MTIAEAWEKALGLWDRMPTSDVKRKEEHFALPETIAPRRQTGGIGVERKPSRTRKRMPQRRLPRDQRYEITEDSATVCLEDYRCGR